MSVRLELVGHGVRGTGTEGLVVDVDQDGDRVTWSVANTGDHPAAVDQLATWAERGGAAIVRPQHEGQDPASVAFQTIEYAKRTGTEQPYIFPEFCPECGSAAIREPGDAARRVEARQQRMHALVFEALAGDLWRFPSQDAGHASKSVSVFGRRQNCQRSPASSVRSTMASSPRAVRRRP